MAIDYLIHNRQDRREYEQSNLRLRIIDLGSENNEVVRSIYLNEDDFTELFGGRREIRFYLEGAIPQPWGGTDADRESELSQAYFDGFVEGFNMSYGEDHRHWFDLPLTREEFEDLIDE